MDEIIAESTVSSPLRSFDLPPELRDMIYNEMWRTTPELRKQAKYNDGTTNSLRLVIIRQDVENIFGDQDELSSVPEWCIIDKVFFKEAMGSLYRHCRWTASVPATLVTTPIMLCDGQRDHSTRMLDIIIYHLKANYLAPGFLGDGPRIGVEKTSSWLSGLHLLSRLNNNLRNAHGVKTLNITFGIRLKKIAQYGGPISADLSEFERSLFTLDKLIIHVLGINAKHKRILDEAERLYSLLKIGIARLAGVLIGSNVRMHAGAEVWVRKSRGKSREHGYWSFTAERVR